MRQAARRWRKGMLLALALLLGGCAAGTPLPLLSPLAAGGDFGYAETYRGEDRYTVTYVTPPRRTLSYGAPRVADTEAARRLAFDFASWRAAQIAAAQGFAGFRITDRRSNVDTYVDPFSGAPWYGDPFWDCWRCRRLGFPYYPAFPASPPYADLQAQVTIDAVMLHELAPGDYNAGQVIEQLRRTYPGADLAPPAG
jgi:hypothetical protein